MKKINLCTLSIEMGATVSAPFKAMSMTNGNVNRAFGVGPSSYTNSSTPAATRRRRNNMTGGKRKRRSSRKGTYRKRR